MLRQLKKRWRTNLAKIIPMLAILLVSGCASFNGIRTPLYDGNLTELNEEAALSYRQNREIIGEEKDHYFRYSFSEDLSLPTLDFSEEDPVLLEEGEYTIGEDVPSGRANLLGNESDFTPDSLRARVGNLTIRDEKEIVYFENHFHSAYGPLHTHVDLREGHTIEVTGTDPEITVFYEEELPEDPYILMTPPESFPDSFEDVMTEEGDSSLTQLVAGIWEVGVHLEAGTYTIDYFEAERPTELYIFRQGEEPKVIELSEETVGEYTPLSLEELDVEGEEGVVPSITLQEGDKVYPNMISLLELRLVE